MRPATAPCVIWSMGGGVGGEEFRDWGAGCRVQGAGCRVQGAGCRVQGAGCRVQGVPPRPPILQIALRLGRLGRLPKLI